MQFFVVILLLLIRLANTTVYINENYSDTKYLKGNITNASFPGKVVRSMGFDCSETRMDELPENFISYLGELKELVIEGCGVNDIKPKAFSYLPFIKNIDLSGNQLRAIASGIFNLIPSLMYLNLSSNSIQTIDNNAFSNMPRLADLDLSHNVLNYISRAWFGNTTTIEEFHIHHNFLKEIPARMFWGWTETYAFNFDYNQISLIGDEVFFVKDINYISLHHNQLTSLNINAFADNSNIIQLDISGNFFNHWPEGFFKRIKVQRLWLFGNPFECSCMKNLEIALESRRVEVVNASFKLEANEKCRKVSNVPVCAVSTATVYDCRGTGDGELIERISDYMKKFGFVAFRDWFEECAVLTSKMYLET